MRVHEWEGRQKAQAALAIHLKGSEEGDSGVSCPAMTMPEQEHARLAGVYSAMSDEELDQIAQGGDELSNVAREALQSEAAKRGLTLAAPGSPGVDVVELSDMVTLRQFRDLPEALLAEGALNSAGIESQLVDDNMIRMDWFISNLLGGIKLKVHAEDVEVANEILNQPIPETIEIEGVGSYAQPKCPQCQSLDISFRELEKVISYGSAFVGVPIPVHHKAWMCHACGHEWEDHDAAPPESVDGSL